MFDAKQLLNDLGVEPAKEYSADQLAEMSDRELQQLRFVDLDEKETKLLINEMEKRSI